MPDDAPVWQLATAKQKHEEKKKKEEEVEHFPFYQLSQC